MIKHLAAVGVRAAFSLDSGKRTKSRSRENIRNIDVGIAIMRVDVRYPMNPIKFAQIIISTNMNVRQTEVKVKNFLSVNKEQIKKVAKEKIRHSDDLNLENEVSDLLNLPVKIKMDNLNKGRVIISFSMLDELQGFLQKIKHS